MRIRISRPKIYALVCALSERFPIYGGKLRKRKFWRKKVKSLWKETRIESGSVVLTTFATDHKGKNSVKNRTADFLFSFFFPAKNFTSPRRFHIRKKFLHFFVRVREKERERPRIGNPIPFRVLGGGVLRKRGRNPEREGDKKRYVPIASIERKDTSFSCHAAMQKFKAIFRYKRKKPEAFLHCGREKKNFLTSGHSRERRGKT